MHSHRTRFQLRKPWVLLRIRRGRCRDMTRQPSRFVSSDSSSSTIHSSLREWPVYPSLCASSDSRPSNRIIPHLPVFPLLEGHPCWSKCGRRTRPFSGRAFREHRTNVGVLPILFIVRILRARRAPGRSPHTPSSAPTGPRRPTTSLRPSRPAAPTRPSASICSIIRAARG